MIDKEKILAKIEFLLNEINYEPFTDEVFGRIQTLKELKSYIDSLQEEPVDKCKGCNNVKGYITCVDGDQWAHYKEPISKELEEASKEWLAPQLDKSYVNYGEVKMMELTHFDGYAMLDAIEFGAKWGKNQAMAEIQAQSMALAHGCPEKSESEDLEKAAEDYGIRQGAELKPFAIKYFKAGSKWHKEQMTSKAIDGRLYSTICGSEQNIVVPAGYGEYGKDGDKVKVIVIKEE